MMLVRQGFGHVRLESDQFKIIKGAQAIFETDTAM